MRVQDVKVSIIQLKFDETCPPSSINLHIYSVPQPNAQAIFYEEKKAEGSIFFPVTHQDSLEEGKNCGLSESRGLLVR